MRRRISRVQTSDRPIRNKREIKRKRRNRRNVSYANKNIVVYKSFQQNPYPQRYRCKFTTAFYGAIAAGTATGSYFAWMNSAYLPFNTGGWPGAASGLSIATLQPTGYSAMVNVNLYNSVRVLSSKITVEFLPQALTDTVEVVVVPCRSNSVPASVQVALSQPWARHHFMSSSKMNTKNGSMITNYISQHKFLGVSFDAIKNDLSGNYTHAYNTNPAVDFLWSVQWGTPDAVNLATALEYRVKLVHYVELYNNTSATLVQT